jgi:hypothetical protein
VAGFQPLRRRVDLFFDDSDSTDDWMAQRNAWLADRQAAEAAGRDAWNQATRAGQDVSAPTQDDLIQLGVRYRGDGSMAHEVREQLPATGPDGTGPKAPLEPIQPAEPDGPMREPPSIGFVTAKSGDSISKLLGTSDPAAIGRFLTLNGMDGRRSGLVADGTYAIPHAFGQPSNDETAAGARLLRADNARLAAVRAQRARRQAEAAQWSPYLKPWIGGLPRSATSIPQPAPRPRTWLDNSVIAKQALGEAAQWAGNSYGLARGGVHTVMGTIDGAQFLARLPFDASAREQARAMANGAVDYVRTRTEQPTLLARDAGTWLRSENEKLNPYATPMADTLQGELQRRFGIGANQGETAFNVGSVLFGGEIAKGLEGIAVARELPAVEKYVRANFAPDLAEYMLEPYPREGMGAHYVPRKTKRPDILGGGPLPSTLIDSKFNVSRLRSANRWQQYKHHFENDPAYYGGAVRGRQGKGTGWSGVKDFGWERNGPIKRMIVGMPADTRGLIGGAIASSVNQGYGAWGEDQPQ